MPSTHQQLLYHVVFSTKNRKLYLANEEHRAKVFAYMAGVARNLDGFALEVGGWIDHAHLLVRIPAKRAVSVFVGGLKANTSKHVNETSGFIKKFGWQEGFGAFSVSLSQKDKGTANCVAPPGLSFVCIIPYRCLRHRPGLSRPSRPCRRGGDGETVRLG